MIRALYRNIKNLLVYSLIRNIQIGSNVAIYNSLLEGKNKIYDDTVFVRSRLGRGSYIGTDGKFGDTVIGRYCSIGNRVKIVSVTHPANTFVSIHPAFFSLLMQAGFTYVESQCFQEKIFFDEINRIAVSIGNDVWIGEEAMIMGGVKIHDGAIIGARSLITKDVAPYSIVGGVPAKEIRKRFSEDEIDFLLKFKWWDKEEIWLTQNIHLFWDIKQLMAHADKM